MHEVKPGVYRWTAPHPDWEPGEDWDQSVVSYAIDDGKHLVVIDPLAPPAELTEMAASRQPIIVLTCPWHRRDAISLAAHLNAPIYVPPPDAKDPDPVPGRVYEAGEKLPAGIEVFAGMERNDLVLWISGCGAIIAGDTVIDRDGQLIIPSDWISGEAISEETVIATLQPLLKLPVEIVLPTHGNPAGADALRTLLSSLPG